MPAVRTPEASRPTRHIAVPRCSLPRRGIGSATSITFDFGANHPFTCVPACNLSVYASQWLLPDTTQDSIRSCPAQALPRPPSQATELNALARRKPGHRGQLPTPGSHRTWRAVFPHHALRQVVHSTFAAIRPRSVSMVSFILSLHRGLSLPLHGAHVAPERITCR
jgi:hypothetical protein